LELDTGANRVAAGKPQEGSSISLREWKQHEYSFFEVGLDANVSSSGSLALLSSPELTTRNAAEYFRQS
jgi:hypothetical protein